MSLILTDGNLFDSGCECLVNPVNCEGVMGRGLALEFKRLFPNNYMHYRHVCHHHISLRPGSVITCYDKQVMIANLATKDRWREPSKLEWITLGLENLAKVLVVDRLRSCALPAIGCGLGGLDWSTVYSEIERILGNLEGIDIKVYPPKTQASR